MTARTTALEHRQRQLQDAAADPDQDAAALLPALSRVSAELKEKAAERQKLQLETRSGRAESLAEAQTLHQLRDAAEGNERSELNARIKAVIPSVLAGVWIQCQRIDRLNQIVHVQIWLHSGACRYVQLSPSNLRGVRPWQLDGFDLRRGPYRPADEADVTRTAQPA